MTDPESDHPDLDTLADLQEGLLDAGAAAGLRRHVDGCSVCRADLDALAAVPGSLAAVAAVGPLPPEVAARLDRALAEEVTGGSRGLAGDSGAGGSRAGDSGDSSAGSPLTTGDATVLPLRPTRSSPPRGMRVLQVAAAVVLVLAGGAVAFSALDVGGGSDQTSATGAGDGGRQEAAPEAATANATFPVTASGRDWTDSTLRDQAPALAAGTLSPPLDTSAYSLGADEPAGDAGRDSPGGGETAREGPAASLSAAPASRLAGGPDLAACVAALVGGPATPIAVDLATFQGKPVAVLLLPGTNGPGTADVWVVGEGCAPGDDQLRLYVSAPLD